MTVQKTATTTDEVDTSTNEETQETDVELEDMDDSFETEDNSTSDDDETEESEESEEDEQAGESTEESEEESEGDADEETDRGDTDPVAERKRHNTEMAQKRIAEREAKEKAKREAQQEFINEAETPQEIAVRQLQVDAYNNRVQSNTDRLINGYDKAVANIDLFRDAPPEVKEELDRAIDDFERMYVTIDRNGDPVEVRGDLYEFLQVKAESIRRLTGIREKNEKKAKVNTQARTFTPPSRAPKSTKDPDLEDFDSVFDD